MRTRIALVALGFVMIAGSGSALAQSRAIAIEPRTEVAAPVAEAPKAEAPVADVKVETPKVEEVKVEAPKEPKVAVVPVVPVKKIIKVAPVIEKVIEKKVFKGPTCR